MAAHPASARRSAATHSTCWSCRSKGRRSSRSVLDCGPQLAIRADAGQFGRPSSPFGHYHSCFSPVGQGAISHFGRGHHHQSTDGRSGQFTDPTVGCPASRSIVFGYHLTDGHTSVDYFGTGADAEHRSSPSALRHSCYTRSCSTSCFVCLHFPSRSPHSGRPSSRIASTTTTTTTNAAAAAATATSSASNWTDSTAAATATSSANASHASAATAGWRSRQFEWRSYCNCCGKQRQSNWTTSSSWSTNNR